MSFPARSRAIASAPVVRKGSALRSDERAKERRALDCRLRCGCFSAMKRMSSFHVPHDQGDGSRPTAARRVPAAKHAASGRYRASMAHRAACCEIDTIPKPDGLAGPVPGPESNGDATKAGRCPALFVFRS